MSFPQKVIDDLNNVFFDLRSMAEYATYITAVGISSTVLVIVEQNEEYQEPYERGEETAKCEAHIRKSDVSDFATGDTLWFRDAQWEIDPDRGVQYEDDNMVTIALRRRD